MNNRTRSRTVNGMISNGAQMAEAPITLRATSDKLGKSVSLSVDGLIMLQIPLEPVSDILDIVEVRHDGTKRNR